MKLFTSLHLFFILLDINVTSDGTIIATRTFDIDDGSNDLINVSVTAFDGVHSVQAEVTLRILPVNEFSPVFKQNEYVWNVLENTERQLVFEVKIRFKKL